MTLKDYSLKQPEAAPDPVKLLDGLEDDVLLRLRAMIDKKLDIDPRSMNLADELGYQYRAGKTLLASIQADNASVPANQRAQVFNSVTMMLEKIAKQMKGVYDAERLKRFEAAFMKTLEDMPDKSKRKFFDLYGEYLTAEQKKET